MSVLNFNVLQRWWDNIVLKNFQSAILGAKTITANGTYDPEDDSLDGYSSVTVNVPSADLGTKTITENGTYTASSDNLDGYSSVTVNVAGEDITPYVTGVFSGDLNLPQTSVGSLFRSATGSFTLNMPNLTTIRDGYAFENSKVESIRFASYAGNISEYTFKRSSIETVFIPNCIKVYRGVFESCTSLVTAVLGSLGTSGTYTQFTNCSSLETVDLVAVSTIDNTWQTGCSSLDTLILRSDTVCTLSNVTAFASTPFASGGAGGTIYVPSDLIDDYEAATNWSTVDAYGTITWAAIEGSTYETKYADGTDIE